MEKLPNKLSNKLDMVYRAICKNNYISNQEVAKQIGISESMVRSYTARLKELNLLKRVGSDKTGHWEIINKNITQL